MPESNPYDFPGINVKWGMAAGGYLSGTYPNPNVAKIKGTITNDNATAGDVGQYIESVISSGSTVTLTNGTPANITSISLTAGDWDVWASIELTGNVLTTVTYFLGSLSLTSATLDTTRTRYSTHLPAGSTVFATIGNYSFFCGQDRLSLSATTTVYLVIQAGFGTSTCSAFGALAARRVR